MSSAPVRSPWRTARTAVASTAAVATALVTHAVGGGSVDPRVAVALLVGGAAVAWPLTERRLGASRILGLLVLCQAVSHLASAGDEHLVGGTTMLLAHGLSTLASAILLTRGERWAWRLATTLALRPWSTIRAAVVRVVDSEPVSAPDLTCRPAPRRRGAPVRGPPVVA